MGLEKVDWEKLWQECPLAVHEYINYQTKKLIKIQRVTQKGRKTEFVYSSKPHGLMSFHVINKSEELLTPFYFDKVGIKICPNFSDGMWSINVWYCGMVLELTRDGEDVAWFVTNDDAVIASIGWAFSIRERHLKLINYGKQVS